MAGLEWAKPGWSGPRWEKLKWLKGGGGSWQAEVARPQSIFKIDGPITSSNTAAATIAFSNPIAISRLINRPLMTVITFYRAGNLVGNTASTSVVLRMRNVSGTAYISISALATLRNTSAGMQAVLWNRFIAPSIMYNAIGHNYGMYAGYSRYAWTNPAFVDLSPILTEGLASNVYLAAYISDARTGEYAGDVVVNQFEVFAYDFV